MTQPANKRLVTEQSGAGLFLGHASPARTPSFPHPVKPSPATVITAMQSGHGWTMASAAGTYDSGVTNLNDTADFVLGTQAAKVATVTTGPTVAQFDSPVGTAIDTTGMYLRVLVKIENLAGLSTLRLYAGDSTFANYTNININTNEVRTAASYLKESEWAWLSVAINAGSVTGTGGRTNTSRYRFAISSTSGQQTVLHVGAVQLVSTSPTFTGGAVSICFDDGRATPFYNAKPKLDALGWRASAYPIIDKVAATTGGTYLTLAQLQQIRKYSGWEIGTHAFTASDHDAGFDTLTAAQVEADIQSEREWLYANNLGRGEGFAWPLGAFSTAVATAASRLVSYGRLNTTAIADETWPPEDPMRIRSYAVSPSTTLASLKSLVDRVSANNGWLCLTFHEITTAGTGTLEWSTQNFSDLCDYIASKGVTVLPVQEVMKRGDETLTSTGASGDLSGRLAKPKVASIQGVAVSGTPSAGQVLTAASASAASWQSIPYPATFYDATFVNNRITAGESSLPRLLVNGGQSTNSGSLLLCYFTAEISETITRIAFSSHTTAAGATPSLVKFGLYSIDGSGNATLVASTASDTAAFATARTRYVESLTASYAKVAGQRYAVGVLVINTATMPAIAGASLGGAASMFNNEAPRLAGILTGQTDLPASYADSALNNGSAILPYAELLR